MKISLIGMSNSGKSFWAKRLEEIGFQRLCSDEYIEEKLGTELKKLGYSGIADVSKWLGQPYENRHKKNSEVYLNFETESLKIFLDKILPDSKKSLVIDTTGSVIYTDKTILEKLKKETKVIYLETPVSVQEQMYRSYIREPKPVLWQKSFYKKNGESDGDALKRCYPELLAFRSEKYRELAEKTIDYFAVRKPKLSVEKFLSLI